MRLGGLRRDFKLVWQKFCKIPSQLIARYHGTYLSSLATHEAEIRRIVILGPPGEKQSSKAPTVKAGYGVCVSDIPATAGSIK
jgi:hypothetical protein